MAETPMPMCPMAETCKGMMRKPFSGLFMIIPGIVFIAVGVLIVIEPRILAWLVAAVCVLMGVAMLMIAKFIRRVGTQS
jgi:uncharacterized membrane protein HdeD (DUF308 family)